MTCNGHRKIHGLCFLNTSCLHGLGVCANSPQGTPGVTRLERDAVWGRGLCGQRAQGSIRVEGENNATSPGTPWSKAGGGHGGGDSEGTATCSHRRRTARFLAQCREVGDGEGMRGGSPERLVATGSPPGRLASGAGTFLHGHRWQEGNDQGTGGSVYIFNGRELRWGSHLLLLLF